MDFYKLKSELKKIKETIIFDFILIFLTAFITKNVILILKKSLVFTKINTSLLLTNLDTSYKYFWVLLLLLLVYFLSLFMIKIRWNIVNKEVKLIVLLSALILTWSTVFSDYNYYENSWFFIDRLILFILCILVFFKPSSIFLFIFYYFIFIEQFDYLMFWGFSLTHTTILIYILMLTWVYLILHKLIKKEVNSTILIILFLGMIMSWYLWAGISKLNFNWLNLNLTYNLFAIRLGYGWLSFFDIQFIEILAATVLKYNYQVQVITLVIELLLPLLIIINKRFLILCLLALIIFHLSVFALSGILFWQWILIEILFIYLYHKKSFLSYRSKYLIYCYYLFVLLISKNYLGVVQLGWLDSSIVHQHRFQLVRNDGSNVLLNSSFFAPFEVSFAKDKFYFLDTIKIVSGTFGGVYDKKIMILNDENNKYLISRNINELGINNYNQEKVNRFIEFLKTFINNKKEIQFSLPVKPLSDIIEHSNFKSYKVTEGISSLLIINETKKVDSKHKKMITIALDTLKISLK